MAVNFNQLIYKPAFTIFARSVTITPLASQPNASPYEARGIFDSEETDINMMDGSIYSDSKIVLDVLIDEFAVAPKQRDLVFIPLEADVAGGAFEVADTSGVGNAGGELTLTLKRIVDPSPGTVMYFHIHDGKDTARFRGPQLVNIRFAGRGSFRATGFDFVKTNFAGRGNFSGIGSIA